MSIAFINPGSGPVRGPVSAKHARANMKQLLVDAEIAKGTKVKYKGAEPDGRYAFDLRRGSDTCEVSMPGRELARVRVTADAEDLLDYPRLYVDGNSYYWPWGVGLVYLSLGAPRGGNWQWEGAKQSRPLFSTPEHFAVRQRALAMRYGLLAPTAPMVARPACDCLSRNLSVSFLSREAAWQFGLHPGALEQGPWCFRCGRPRETSTPC